MKKNYLKSILALALSLTFFCGCAKSEFQAPFTDVKLGTPIAEVTATLGEEQSSYPSLYNGTTYLYDKEYMDKAGSIKYMTNKDGNVLVVAWSYKDDESKNISDLYTQLQIDLTKEYGNPEQANGVNNYVQIWKLKEGHIVLSGVLTSDTKALQLAFMSQAAVDYEAEDVEVENTKTVTLNP